MLNDINEQRSQPPQASLNINLSLAHKTSGVVPLKAKRRIAAPGDLNRMYPVLPIMYAYICLLSVTSEQSPLLPEPSRAKPGDSSSPLKSDCNHFFMAGISASAQTKVTDSLIRIHRRAAARSSGVGFGRLSENARAHKPSNVTSAGNTQISGSDGPGPLSFSGELPTDSGRQLDNTRAATANPLNRFAHVFGCLAICTNNLPRYDFLPELRPRQ